MISADILTGYVGCVHPNQVIQLLEVVRSSEVFALEDVQRGWEAPPEALRSVIAGFYAAGVLNPIDENTYELTDDGRAEVNRFFTGIAWARRGGRWDQPLSVAYSTAVALFDQAIKDFGQRLPYDEAQALLDLLDAALSQERDLPGVIFEAMSIGGGNARFGRPIRCGMVYWLKGRVQEIRGDLDGAIQAFRIAFENFSKHGRADLLFSVRADVERLWRLICSTRSLGQQATLQKTLEQWVSDHLPEVGKQIWCGADFYQSTLLESLTGRATIGMPAAYSSFAFPETPSTEFRIGQSAAAASATAGPSPARDAVVEYFRKEYQETPVTDEAWDSRFEALGGG